MSRAERQLNIPERTMCVRNKKPSSDLTLSGGGRSGCSKDSISSGFSGHDEVMDFITYLIKAI